MQKELLDALRASGKAIAEKTMDWTGNFEGESSADSPAAFFGAHPSLTLPDSLLGTGKGDIRVSLHTREFDGVPHCHEFVEVVYVCEGSVTDCIGGERLTLSAGDACIHTPGSVHFIRSRGENDILLNILLSRRVFGKAVYSAMAGDNRLDRSLSRYMTDGGGDYRVFRTLAPEVAVITELLVKEFYRPDGRSEVVMENILLLLFAELMREQRQSMDVSLGERVERYIAEHIAAVTALSCAAAFGYHPKYFSTLVKKETGRRFGELLTDCRIRIAASHLQYTDYTISEIAEMVGYRDTVSLYTNFKRLRGMSPGEFREKSKDDRFPSSL